MRTLRTTARLVASALLLFVTGCAPSAETQTSSSPSVPTAASSTPSEGAEPLGTDSDSDLATGDDAAHDDAAHDDTGRGEVGASGYDATVEGVEVLYIGHSFGRPFASNLGTVTEIAGVEGHEQHIIFRGGENGAPQAMWEAPRQQALIKEQLDTGTVDVVVMICCSVEFRETEGASDQAIVDIASYALEQNPDTRIGLAMPWIDFPSAYASAEEHGAVTDAAWPAYEDFAERLRVDLDADVFAFYHGAAVLEIRAMFEDGQLSDVDTLIGPKSSSVFTDEKGHAATLAKDTGTLIWLHAIYGIDPLDVAPIGKYDVDIRQVAAVALDRMSS